MNTLTKAVIIVNFILALCAAYAVILSYAAPEYDKRMLVANANQTTAIIERQDQEIEKQSLRASTAEAALSVLEGNLGILAADNEALRGRIQAQHLELGRKDSELKTKEETIVAQGQTISGLEEDKERLLEQSNLAQQIANVARAVAAELNVTISEVEDDLNASQLQLQKLNEKLNSLNEEHKDLQARVAVLKQRHPDIYDEVWSGENTYAAEEIQGQVTTIVDGPNGNQDLVMISVGKDDSVKVGMEFIVYRGDGEYIAKCKVARLFGDTAGCTVLQDTWNSKGLKIQVGDRVMNSRY